MAQQVCVVLSTAEREQLTAIVADRNRPRKQVERARIVRASADRHSAQQVVQSRRQPTDGWRWQQRLAENGVEGLLRDKTRNPGKAPIGAETAARVVALTRTPAAPGNPLDRPGDGQSHRHLGGFGAAHLAGAQTAAAPAAHVQALARFRLCRQAHRHCRALSRSTGPRRGIVDRRKEPDPSARPHPTGLPIKPSAAKP